MSWQPPLGCCRECVCAGMWRVEGLGLQGRGAEAGCSGSQEGTGWGKGMRERSQVEKSPTQFVSHAHMALCQMLSSNYLESHHTVLTGNTTY